MSYVGFMARTSLPLVVVVLLAPSILSGCATSRFDQLWESGRYDEAIQEFEADRSLQTEENALFRAALAHAVPGTPTHHPERAEELLRRLIALHPGSARATDANRLLTLLAHIERLDQTVKDRDEAVRDLTSRVQELEERARIAELLLEHQTTRSELLHELKSRLERDLREAQDQLHALQEELRQLKEVDLKRSGSGGT